MRLQVNRKWRSLLSSTLSHFGFQKSLGSILDNVTFALNFVKMAEKDTNMQDDNTTNNSDIDINTDENQSGTSHLNEPIGEESELEKLKAELQETKDKYLRKVAEFENFKRRNAKERIELIQTAGKEVITALLDVLDDCDRAQKQIDASDDVKEIKEGVMLVFNKLRNVLQARGLKPMETKNQEFNPDLHEAITEIPAPSPELKNKVVDEVMKGYYLNDKIIRYAKVVVGK
jgi:molecular chaperone GrpE